MQDVTKTCAFVHFLPSAPNPDAVSAFAAQRSSDGALTIMIIGKGLTGTTAATVSLANFTPAGTAQVWQLTSANSITRLADITVTGTSFSTTVSPQSITLFVVPTAGVRPNPPTNVRIVGSSTGAP